MHSQKPTLIALSIGIIIALVFGGFLTWVRTTAEDIATTDSTASKKIVPTAAPGEPTTVEGTPEPAAVVSPTATSAASGAIESELINLDKDLTSIVGDTTETSSLSDDALGI
jgi:hypothetical protein